VLSDYKTIDKTGWFIQKMRSGWFSRAEILGLAAREFLNLPTKTLDGTIGVVLVGQRQSQIWHMQSNSAVRTDGGGEKRQT
jgi:hypothetical protein